MAPPLREPSFNFNLDDWELDRGMSGSSFLLPGNSGGGEAFDSPPPNAAGSLAPQPQLPITRNGCHTPVRLGCESFPNPLLPLAP